MFFTIFTLFSVIISKYDIKLLTNDKIAKELIVFIDFSYAYTLIESSKFDCSNYESCEWYNTETQTAQYLKKTYSYKEAFLTIKIPTDDVKNSEFKTQKIMIRITSAYNVLGINSTNTLSKFIDKGNEIIVDLKKKKLFLQKMDKNNSKSLNL